MAVICQLFDAGLRLSALVLELCQLFETGWRVSEWVYELCKIIEAGWWLSVSYMRQDDSYLLVT
jgi:hypothetical protein